MRIDKKRKFPATTLLRVMGYDTNEAILEAFKKNDTATEVIKACLAKDTAKTLMTHI